MKIQYFNIGNNNSVLSDHSISDHSNTIVVHNSNAWSLLGRTFFIACVIISCFSEVEFRECEIIAEDWHVDLSD